MTQEFKFKQYQYVKFHVDGTMSGEGQVVGCSATPQFGIGGTYIIKVAKSTADIPNDEYPFDTIAIPEMYITTCF